MDERRQGTIASQKGASLCRVRTLEPSPHNFQSHCPNAYALANGQSPERQGPVRPGTIRPANGDKVQHGMSGVDARQHDEAGSGLSGGFWRGGANSSCRDERGEVECWKSCASVSMCTGHYLTNWSELCECIPHWQHIGRKAAANEACLSSGCT